MPGVGEGRSAVYDLPEVCAWFVRTGRTAPRLSECMAGMRTPGGARLADDVSALPDPFPAVARESRPPDPVRVAVAVAESAKGDRPAPTGQEERRLAVEARGRFWRLAAEAGLDIERRFQAKELEITPSQAESLARAARTLSEAVRGDASEGTRRTLRDSLVAGMRQWVKQWGRPALDELVREATS